MSIPQWAIQPAQQSLEQEPAADWPVAELRLVEGWADWQAMAAGQLDGMTAFMTGKLKVEGDMSNAIKNGKVPTIGSDRTLTANFFQNNRVRLLG